MKTLSKILSVAALLVALTVLTGCLSSAMGGSGSDTVDASKVTTVKMYVNIPTDQVGTEALALVKITNGSFSDPRTFTFTGSPTTEAAKEVTTYYTYCAAVNSALGKLAGTKSTLTFNTMKDGSGWNLNFSDTTSTLRSLLYIAAYDVDTVYALYSY